MKKTNLIITSLLSCLLIGCSESTNSTTGSSTEIKESTTSSTTTEVSSSTTIETTYSNHI